MSLLRIILIIILVFSYELSFSQEDYKVSKSEEANSCIEAALLNSALKNYDACFLCLKKAIQLDPYFAKAYHMSGAIKMIELKDYKAAIADFNMAIKLEPTFSAYYFRGGSKLKLKDFRGAIIDLEKALKIDSEFADVYYCLSKAYLGVKNYKVSIEYLNRHIKLDPSSNAYFLRGIAKLYTNQKNSACLDFRKANELGEEKANEAITKYCK